VTFFGLFFILCDEKMFFRIDSILFLLTHVTQKDKKKELYIEEERSGEFQWTKFLD